MKRIFIIEDDQELSRMYERVFRLRGYSVEVAHDGKEALEKIQKITENPDIVLLDVLIPSVSGIDVLRTIKQDERLKNVPVIILTNSFRKENEELFLSLGASRYLVKIENEAQDIVREVDQLLAARGAS